MHHRLRHAGVRACRRRVLAGAPARAETFAEAVLDAVGPARRGSRCSTCTPAPGCSPRCWPRRSAPTGRVLGLESAAGRGRRRRGATWPICRGRRCAAARVDPAPLAALDVASPTSSCSTRRAPAPAASVMARDPGSRAARGRLRGLRPGGAGPRRARSRVDAGWRLAALRAFDAFPMTHHVECVAALQARRDGGTSADGRVEREQPIEPVGLALCESRSESVCTCPADLRALEPRGAHRCWRPRSATSWCSTVARTGGHLGPNLGAVELTIALHRVFDSPTEPILFDTGHQAYVHKILTGRAERIRRRCARPAGCPATRAAPRAEHDWIENSHASTALSYADGLAKAFAVRGERRPVVAVVGDGALTGGMCWEALNNIAASDRPVVIVVNDNGRSYSPTIGGLAEHLAGLRLRPGYERMLGQVKGALGRTPVVGAPLYDALHGMKRGIKDLLAPQGMFEDLGLKYVGPVDGHDVDALETRFRAGARLRRPGASCTASPARATATRRPRTTRPTRCTSRAAFDPETGVAAGEHRPHLDERVRRGARRGSASSATTSWRSPRRCATRPGSARSRAASRTAATTSASPSSTRSPRRPGWRRAACTRSSRSTPPSSTGPSTSC